MEKGKLPFNQQKVSKERLTPLKAIRARCLDCQGNRPSGVRKCEDVDCPHYCFRFGKNPNRKGVGRVGGNPFLNQAVRL